ncbi:hypothetical protein CPB85DRAFT_1316920 [Mucidula mucida]|nr:hypothetical protein CPB85DRAFT_1316920 [Mucidula mucida]
MDRSGREGREMGTSGRSLIQWEPFSYGCRFGIKRWFRRLIPTLLYLLGQ